MGLGKTLEFIAYAAINPELRPACVVCPATLKYNWQEEFWKHARLEADVIEGGKPTEPDGNIWIINYDIVKQWLAVLRGKVKLLGIDEFQKIKNPTAKRTKACVKLAKKTPHVVFMSGTPIINRPIEFFPALNVLDPITFPSYMAYGFRYCNPKPGYGGRGWDFSGSGNLAELHELVSPLMIRRTKAEVLPELPEKIRSIIPIKINNRKDYDHARDEFIEWVQLNRGAAAAKRASGAVALVKYGVLKTIAALGKLNAIRDWVEDWFDVTGEKLVLFTTSREVNLALTRVFPTALFMDGDTPIPERAKMVTAFQTMPKHKLIIGTEVMWEGVTLTASSTVGFIQLGWAPTKHDQAEDRVLRIGQTANKVNAYYFIAKNTVDEDVLEMLDEKRDVISQVVDGKPEGAIIEGLLTRLLKKGK